MEYMYKMERTKNLTLAFWIVYHRFRNVSFDIVFLLSLVSLSALGQPCPWAWIQWKIVF